MRGASLASLTTARTALNREMGGAASSEVFERAGELFAVVDALDANPAALRALANPNRPAGAKRTMVNAMMAGHDPSATAFAADLAAARWSHDADLSDAFERLGVEATMIAIGPPSALEHFENDMFAVERFLAAQPDVEVALADADAAPAARIALARRLWAADLAPTTMTLVERAVRAPRGRSLVASLILLAELAADRRGRMVASVVSALPLTDAQTGRLAAILADAYGYPVHLDASVDPGVMGGLRVVIGSDLLDATLLARFVSLRRAIAS
ncbi:MAG: F0F1 ATP synthase subunit delta [Bifidobacteriaceae bacterium]|jgi:F-type H+-transporting ATPase subunit delta|nr:F0F1 ATP synthase subunit delta [Bifidobacteriaceae bacterium]